MEPVKLNPRTGKPKISSRGGARSGAGRPRGDTNKLTAKALFESVLKHTGQDYADILVTDFLMARQNSDHHLVQKYHNIMLNKMAANLSDIEVKSDATDLEARKQAFADALKALMTVKS